MSRLPQRIVCLTTETVEVLYALGEQDRIAGISGYTVRPPQARKEKPKVYAFTSGDIDKILAVQPDLVLTFSDLQADIARDLIKAGVPVYAFNMRSVDDILGMIETLGRLVGAEAKAAALVAELEAQIEAARAIAAERLARNGHRPRVYFEEWDEPNITAVRWVSELIEIAGGADIFPERAGSPLARDRILAEPLEIVRRDPEVIIGSWCGKHFRPERISARPGWSTVAAVQNGRLHEIKSAIILTPGPVAISEGLPLLLELFDFAPPAEAPAGR
ncbi:ABC transporter substrate-binding protein [Quatrionicoccus australiensis]|uniref:ABC transporter substrate-binding protein n=1 Tax=Quatrionicoccus australiensis TaxID=138118 RepID=UPI001CF91B46|nr:ABC transporter substrate-binding protein [Quatrionicoccus australiensis]UCV15245.1 ABC transporter substrate-binding protein [Quatrionicoccus australiensis]